MTLNMHFKVDGGCRRNGYSDAIGAAAAVMVLPNNRYNAWTRNLPNYMYQKPTNQRAEITAIILALEMALEQYDELGCYPIFMYLKIQSDSKYAVRCMNEWIYKWTRNGWTNAAGNEVANRDLIEEASELDDKVKELGQVTYEWIPRGNNQTADKLCNEALDDQE